MEKEILDLQNASYDVYIKKQKYSKQKVISTWIMVISLFIWFFVLILYCINKIDFLKLDLAENTIWWTITSLMLTNVIVATNLLIIYYKKFRDMNIVFLQMYEKLKYLKINFDNLFYKPYSK